MLPTVPETTQSSLPSDRFFGLLSSVGGSLVGSGALAALAVCCLILFTGMNTADVNVTRSSSSVLDAVQGSLPSVPESTRIRWIKNIVEEPMQLRRDSFKQMDSASPLGLTLPLVSC